ncbi:hypothetical protein OUZ56_005607 [Daphnia magna]|uniref:Uncharacterized protein n=1 Tax=Daphnia magna TaxID=35525 RepID=A0ABQ9YTC2_9CRUS|nr:hypothetical protein OUZ56_005607 [Daphnia magna]
MESSVLWPQPHRSGCSNVPKDERLTTMSRKGDGYITGPNSFALEGHPFVETSWLRTATEKMTNCRLEEVTLQSECPNCTISSPLGDLPGAINGSFKQNLVTLVWDDSWKEAKPCELRVIEKGIGVKYSTENDTTFLPSAEEETTAYHPVLGMDRVVIAVR